MSHVFLPLRDELRRVIQITVGLRVNDNSLVRAPMADAAYAFLEVDDDAVEEVFATVSVLFQQTDCPFAFGYLLGSVATETDALYPFHLGKQSGDVVRHQACVKPLVEVHAVLTPGDFLYLLQSVIGSEYVVVHEDEVGAPVNGYLVHVHVWGYLSFFLWYYAPLAAVGASTGEESVGGLAVYLRIDGVVGLEAVNLGREGLVEVVACPSALHAVGVYVVAVVGCEGEYLGHISFVVMVDAVVPFHGVALRLVEGGYFHQGEVGILAVYGDEGDVHWVMGMKKPASCEAGKSKGGAGWAPPE